jgi:uncharacterized membrane protein YjgN (DUF898 family)
MLWRYEADNSWFGEQRLRYDGRGVDLLGALLGSYFVMFLVLLAGGTVLAGAGYMLDLASRIVDLIAAASGAGGPGATRGLVLGILWAVVVLVLSIAGGWLAASTYLEAEWLDHMIRHTRLGPVALAGRIGWGSLLRLRVGNFALLLVTLGLGWPFIAQRTLRFLCRRIEVHGTAALDDIVQQPGAQRPRGEGLAQLLDTGGFA